MFNCVIKIRAVCLTKITIIVVYLGSHFSPLMGARHLAPDVHSCHSWVTVVLREHSAAEFTAAVEIPSQANVVRAPL